MNLIYDALMSQLSHPHLGSGGWHSFNAVCCPHVGTHRPDSRKRGGLKLDGATVIYHCHNCHFRTGWTEGHSLSRRMENLLDWAGLSSDQLRDLKFRIGLLRFQATRGVRITVPDGLKSIHDWLHEGCTDAGLLAIADSIAAWDEIPDLHEVYWTPDGNGEALDTYIFLLKGDLSWPTGYVAMPFLDREQPSRTHQGIDPESEDQIPPETLAEMDRLMREHPDGTNVV